MDANQILKSDWLDILFDGKNKEYGAYELRKTYNRRITKAVIGMLIIVGLVLIGRVVASSTGDKTQDVQMVVDETQLQDLKQPDEPPPPPPELPKLPPPPQVATVQVTTPTIVKDEEVVEPPPDVQQIQEAKIDIKTQEGIRDEGFVAPPSEEIGTNVVAAPPPKKKEEDKIFTKVEKEAQFPGGVSEWTKYVTKALQSRLDEFNESDYGTCIVKFVVDKTGKVSQVEAQTMQGTKLAEIAVNAIRQGPRWIPAQQNGRYVNAYRIQPVTLKDPNF